MSWDMFVFLMFFLIATAALFVTFAFMKWKISSSKRDLQASSRQLLTEAEERSAEAEERLAEAEGQRDEVKSDQEAPIVRFNLNTERVFTLPLPLLLRLAQQDRITQARTTRIDRVTRLVERIKEGGVTRPAMITVSRDGKLVLQDGHHLLVAAEFLELTHLPCKVQVSDNGIKIPSQLVSDLLEELLLTANTH